MKNIRTISALLCLGFLACQKAENKNEDLPTNDFQIEASSSNVSKTGVASDEEIVAKSSVRNLSTETIKIRWLRVSKIVSPNWEMAVCDTNACYFPSVDSADFEIPAQKSARLWAYFYPSGNTGSGSSEVRVFDPNNRTQFITIKYQALAE